MSTTVYLPVTLVAAQGLAAGEVTELAGQGHAVTPGLLSAHGLAATDTEDGDFTALGYAGVGALLVGAEGPRVVLAADVTPDQLQGEADDPFGLVQVRALRWGQVQAVFSDDPAHAEPLARARCLVAGLDVAAAIDHPGLEDLVDDCDLLWFAPTELPTLA
ncbi:MAG: hypothetical protein JWP61_2628 [Friedmanniella sp.]|nr:hypothetical protein [Friedmanniella sp.]